MSALGGLFGLIMTVSMGVDLAAAHPGDDARKDAEHATQDLAGTSIAKIERDTRANADKIKKATGHAPGHAYGRSERTQRPSLSRRGPGPRSGRSLEFGNSHRPRD